MIDKVKGQVRATNFLKGVVQSGRFPKAMLFHGPDGVGKGFTAKQFAIEANLKDDIDQDRLLIETVWDGTHPEVHLYRPDDCYTDAELKRRTTPPTWRVGAIRDLLTKSQGPVMYARRRFVIFEDFHRLPPGRDSIPDAFLKILEDGVPDTTFIILARKKEDLPGTLLGRLTEVKFAPLDLNLVRYFLSDHAGAEHFDLCCNLSGGSLDKALDFLYPTDSEGLTGYEIRERAIKLFAAQRNAGSGSIIMFVNAIPEGDLHKFYDALLSVYRDLLLLESGISEDLLNTDRLEVLTELAESYQGKLSKGFPVFQSLKDRLSRPGVNFGHQIKASLIDFRDRIR